MSSEIDIALSTRYLDVKRLGKGGMGVVYRAKDRVTGGIVAVKVLHRHLAENPEFVTRFKKELLLARSITHKNVCRVFDLHEDDDGRLFLAMEYVPGETRLQSDSSNVRRFEILFRPHGHHRRD